MTEIDLITKISDFTGDEQAAKEIVKWVLEDMLAKGHYEQDCPFFFDGVRLYAKDKNIPLTGFETSDNDGEVV